MANVTHQTEDGIEIFRIEGKLDSEGIHQLKSKVLPYIENPKVDKVLLALEKATTANSATIGLLISFHKNMVHREALFVLCDLNDYLLELIHMVRLQEVFYIYPSFEEAMTFLKNS